MHRQLDRVLAAGVAGVVACGKAGEFEGINAAEFEQVLSLVLEGVAGQVPVGAGIISVECEAGVQAAACAARCGADFAMVKKLTRQRLHPFYLEIAERLPVMVYDQSNEGNLDLEREVLPLLQASERIIALKVSGNVYSFGRLKEAAPDVPLLCGWDTFSLLAYLSGSAAVMPEREVELHQLALAGRWEEARELFYQRMLPLIAFSTPDPYAFSVCKLVLRWRGLFDAAVVRPPYVDAPPWMEREIRALARQLELVD